MWQEAFIKAITRELSDEPGLVALLLGGSFGRGEADAFSDVDLLAVVKREDQAAFVHLWRDHVEAVLPIVFWYEARSGGPVHNAIGQRWERIDLTITDPEAVQSRPRESFQPLIDRAGLYDRLADAVAWSGPDKIRVSSLIDEFIRVLGLLPVGIGREEYLTVRAGLEMQRMALFQLLSEEVERIDKGGMLAWSRRLSVEHIALLEGLPDATLTRQSLIDANLAVAMTFLTRARALAKRWDIVWPTAFEAATWANLERTLNIQNPTASSYGY